MCEETERVQILKFDFGEYTGHIANNRPHGNGKLVYKDEDEMGRLSYEGDWTEGNMHGEGVIVFANGDRYEGEFRDNVPSGKGKYRYKDGGLDEGLWEQGVRHGLARYESVDGTVEEIMFWEGEPDGPSKLIYPDGLIENRTYGKGVKNGQAERVFVNGDKLEFSYENGEADGPAVLTSQTAKEEFTFVAGRKQGLSILHCASGEREERNYVNGILEGEATVYGTNGDKLEFTYKNGKRFGIATYYWADGTVEKSFYNENGVHSGPAKLIWPNGATREGLKVDGKWDGEIFYTYAEGPRKGKKDKEIWSNGELVSSTKFYGQGETIEVNDWEDLKKLEPLTKASSEGKDVFYDCLPTL